MKLKNIHKEIEVNVESGRMWEVLSRYGDVSGFHAGVADSAAINGGENKAALGCERVCNIVDMGLKIQLKERIFDYREGVGYQYEVYEWKNFPLRKMLFSFSISESRNGQCILQIDIDYKARPAFLTPLMVWKMKIMARDILLGYKHHAETGETNTAIRLLRKKYSGRYKSSALPVN